jgi:NADPH:quinone reductase-like Zn-dependent oxidoreductase
MKALLAVVLALGCVSPVLALPDTMHAAAADHGGGPEVLSIHEVPVPKIEADEVLIALHTASVASWEAGTRQNAGGHLKRPMILGSDGAGEIAAVGSGVHGFKVGDKVYACCGRGGFYAEYVAVKADRVAHLPKGMDLAQAGVLAISGFSALQGLDDVLGVKRGETLIIHGATGAVGTLAIQFAKQRGAKVLATASSEEGVALARRLGADVVVNGRTEDIVAAAKKFAPGGVDAVFGLAGGDALEHCIDALRQDGQGRVAYMYGLEPLPKPRYRIRMTLYSFNSGKAEFERLNRAAEAAKLIVPVGAEYPLANAAEAHKRLEAHGVLGKIELRIR